MRIAKRFGRWLVRYSPSIGFILEMGAIYFLLVFLLSNVVWPYAFLNGEPVTVGQEAGAAVRAAQRQAFQSSCIRMYWDMGIVALTLYGIYSLNGFFRMSHEAHVRFCKDCRAVTLSSFFLLEVNACENLFTLPTVGPVWRWLRVGSLAIGLLLTGISLFRLALRDLGKLGNEKYSRPLMSGLYIAASMALAFALGFYDELLSIVGRLLQGIPTLLSQASVAADAYHFQFRVLADGLFPLLMVLLWILLLLATTFAAPLAASSPTGGGLHALVHVPGQRKRRDAE
ncbi:MAG: hypothetical protein PHY64_00710 [Eubacteriales bacterium]|nr:hypothetical protein [Eubacteriales bacterium]